MGLRSTYNTGEYNSGLFGAPETTQGASNATFSISAAVSAVTIINAAASTSITITATASDGTVVKEGAASIAVVFSTTASGIVFPAGAGFRDGYGKSNYGKFVYGENYSVEDGLVNAAISITATASGQVTRNVSAATAISITGIVSGFSAIVGSSSATVSISTNVSYNRVRLFSSATTFTFTPSSFARYKWLDVTNPSTTWTDANFLERAA